MKEATMPVAPLFKPFRALGYITDNVPFAVNRRGKETFVTVSVGKAWQVGGGRRHQWQAYAERSLTTALF